MNTGLVVLMVKATAEEKLAAKELEYFMATARAMCKIDGAFSQTKHPASWRGLLNRVAPDDAKTMLKSLGFEIDGGELMSDGTRIPLSAAWRKGA